MLITSYQLDTVSIIYQQLRSEDFLCSLLNYARFAYHTTRFMIWGVYSARPGRSEQVEDPRYQKHWKASVPSVPSVPSILRNPRDRTSDSGLLWASLRICPKVKLRSFTRQLNFSQREQISSVLSVSSRGFSWSEGFIVTPADVAIPSLRALA